MRSSGSKVGRGLDPDGFSGPDGDCRVFCFSINPVNVHVVIQMKFDLQKGQKMWKPPLHVVQAYGWELKT